MPRAGLTAEAVVAAAGALADERGLDGVTLSELAGRLGVRPPSLYAHVGGLEDPAAALPPVAPRSSPRPFRRPRPGAPAEMR